MREYIVFINKEYGDYIRKIGMTETLTSKENKILAELHILKTYKKTLFLLNNGLSQRPFIT